MEYTITRLENNVRFGALYDEIYAFLSACADHGVNEHFPWGRFEWMMQHSMLDADKLDRVCLFRAPDGALVGLVTFDTDVDDNTYLVHSSDDETLLAQMLDCAAELYAGGDGSIVVANSGDEALLALLRSRGYEPTEWLDAVLELPLTGELDCSLPEGLSFSPENFTFDLWQYQLLLHKGFDHEAEEPLPEPWPEGGLTAGPHYDKTLNTFVLTGDEEYCAHCGCWYTGGRTAYIEPVVTIPGYRGQGIGRAVVYEAVSRARARGAERAVVLSTQEFYHRLGFRESSRFVHWIRKG